MVAGLRCGQTHGSATTATIPLPSGLFCTASTFKKSQMICKLINDKNINWNYLSISYRDFKQKLPWILKPVNDWPPHNYPWSIRDDIQILFLVSTLFESSMEIKKWMHSDLKIKINDNLNFVLNFIYSSEKKTDSFFVIREILERSLLWYDPAYSWTSCFCGILEMANTVYLHKERNKGIDLSNLTLGNPYIEGYYEWRRNPHTYIYHKLKKHCDELFLFGTSLYAEVDLFLQAYQCLMASIHLFFEKNVSLSGYNYELKLQEIINKETLWCKKQCKRMTLLSYDSRPVF